jgi:tetratricopeptide (TPR) repeat protein
MRLARLLKGTFALDKSNSRAELEESVGYFEKAINQSPGFAPAYMGLAEAHFELSTIFIGDRPEKLREEAMSEAQKAVELDPQSADAHRRNDALRLLAELNRRNRAGYVPAGAFVNAYLGLADYDQAFIWLERGYKEKSNILQFVRVHPFFDPVRSDPRFVDLVRRVGLN